MKMGLGLFLTLLSLLEQTHGSDVQVTPVQKVIELLQHMADKGKKDMQFEKVQYAAYEQFCISTIAEKERVLDDTQEKIDVLKADTAKLKSDIAQLGPEIVELTNSIEGWNADIANATNVRAAERKSYNTALYEYTHAIDNVAKAYHTIKDQEGNRPQSFMQLASALQKSSGADGDDGESRAAIEAFIAESSVVSYGDEGTPGQAHGYEFQSGFILELLEKLRAKFKKERNDLEKDELDKKHNYEMLHQDWTSQITTATKTKEDKEALKLRKEQTKSEKVKETDDTVKLFKDDTDYLADLNRTCNQKAKAFKERQRLRGEEITAITKAADVMKGTVLGLEKKHRSLIQISSKVAAVSLAFLRSDFRGVTKDRALSMLRERGQVLRSRMLSALAIRAEGSGLGQVRKMISDLINRLQKEALSDAEKHGWCQKELAVNEQTRTTKAQQYETLNGEIHTLETDITSLGEDIADLSKDLAELNKARSNATRLRADEKAENEETIKDAVEAQQAVAQAISILNGFYGGDVSGAPAPAAPGGASLLQEDAPDEIVKPEAPPVFEDAGYDGMTDRSGGVTAMLEVVQSDFARLESTTQAEESMSLGEYTKFMSDSGADKAAKEKEVELKSASKKKKTSILQSKEMDFKDTDKALRAAKEYYEELKPECLHPGLTREEKIEKRKQEIETLKDVLDVLQNS
eukprot:TRINITY_DN96580_c0_g1_i1.p1 TRINITY_DN96580_c0_g1~~TRINITY_DN96580_c0_g1_i1.p1  ORF type:complete len:692 (-),score=213.63 TRINITY_DN96580_c0_g1_i1:14-2089(-)